MRKRIQEGHKVKVRLKTRDKELIEEHCLADPEYAGRLHPIPGSRTVVGEFDLDELEDLLGYVAAEANHADSNKLKRELDSLHEKLLKIQRSYDDGNWQDGAP